MVVCRRPNPPWSNVLGIPGTPKMSLVHMDRRLGRGAVMGGTASPDWLRQAVAGGGQNSPIGGLTGYGAAQTPGPPAYRVSTESPRRRPSIRCSDDGLGAPGRVLAGVCPPADAMVHVASWRVVGGFSWSSHVVRSFRLVGGMAMYLECYQTQYDSVPENFFTVPRYKNT